MTKKSMNLADIAMPGEKTAQWQRPLNAAPPAFPEPVDMRRKLTIQHSHTKPAVKPPRKELVEALAGDNADEHEEYVQQQ